MGSKNFYRNRNMETSVFGAGDRWLNKEERSAQFDGAFVRSGNNRNNSKMGEALSSFLNIIGLTTYVMGIIVNLNNWVSIALGAAGFGYGVFRALKERENWLERRIERKTKEREFFLNRTIEESEKDEHPPAKK